MLKTIIVGAIVALTSTSAFATNPGNNGGGNGGCGVGQTTNGCGGTGGAGGNASAAAIAAQSQGQSQNSRNTNANVNDNHSAGGAGGTGGNSLSRGGDQTQGQTTSVSNVGNTTYTPSASSAYSMAYGQFCIGAVGAGVQPPMMLPGVSFSITWMRDLCRWGHIAEMREKVGDNTGAEWARCQISEYSDADRYGSQQCPANRAKPPIAAANNALPPNCVQQTVGGKAFITCK